MKKLLTAILCLLCLTSQGGARFPHGSASAPAEIWSPIKIGNGGALVRFDIANDGSMVVGTDSYGCYVWGTPTANQWNQLLTDTSLGAAGLIDLTQPTGSGCDDIIIDHSNSNIVWAKFGGNYYKSTNKGGSFATTGWVTTPDNLNGINNPRKNYGPEGAIDPANSNIGYFATTAQGVYRTITGGSGAFTQLTDTSSGLTCRQQFVGGSVFTVGTDTTNRTITNVNGTSLIFNNHSGTFGFDPAQNDYVKVWSAANPFNQMVGLVTAESSGSFTMTVLTGFGSGAHTDWVVGPPVRAGRDGYVNCGSRVAFDTSGGTQANVFAGGGLCTKNIFIHTYGVDTYKSVDCGQTWTPVNSTNKPTSMKQMRVDPFGVLWVLTDDYNGTTNNVYKLDGTTWTNIANPADPTVATYTTVAVDPLNCASKITCHVTFVAGGNTDRILHTTDGGTTLFNSGGNGLLTFPNSGIDVDWFSNLLTAQGNSSPFANVSAYDPITAGKMWTVGEGVFSSTPPAVANASVAMTQQTRGIEEFIAIKAVATPSKPGGVYLTTWDIPCFYTENFGTYPTGGTCQPGTAQANLERGYSLDWAFGNSSVMASIVQDGQGGAQNSTAYEFSGVTTTGGATAASWTKFAQRAPYSARATGSTIAAATFSKTGSIATGILTVTAAGTGSVRVGSTISGTGINAGSTITGSANKNPTACSPNCTGAGGTGTYAVNGTTTAASTTVSGTYGLFTVGTVTTTQNNLFQVDHYLAATGSVPDSIPGAPGYGPFMSELISGTGGTGSTFALNLSATVASQIISQISGQSGGCIAIKDATHMLWLPGENQAPPQFTTDGGATWADAARSGTAASSWGTFSDFTAPAKGCESDKANGDIYVLNVNDGAHSNRFTFYKSTDGGANLTITAYDSSVTPLTGQFNINEFIKSTGVAGHLLLSGGNQATPLPQNSLFYITTDGFTTLTTITGFKTVMAADYGATWPGKTYPGIYAQGWYSGTCLIGGVSQTCTNEYGLWMCKELNTSAGTCNTTWSRLGTRWPLGVLATITDIAADKITPGKVVTWGHGGAYWIQGS